MIALARDCLVFKLAGGESVPFTSEMISFEMTGQTGQWFDPDDLRQAAKAVFHYFKHELGLETISVGDFTGALEKVLGGVRLGETPAAAPPKPHVLELDLCRLALESAGGCELFFFPRLRDALRQNLQQSPRVLRFRGLRGCVKQLMGQQRWTLRCQNLKEQILGYLDECLGAETRPSELALLVD